MEQKFYRVMVVNVDKRDNADALCIERHCRHDHGTISSAVKCLDYLSCSDLPSSTWSRASIRHADGSPLDDDEQNARMRIVDAARNNGKLKKKHALDDALKERSADGLDFFEMVGVVLRQLEDDEYGGPLNTCLDGDVKALRKVFDEYMRTQHGPEVERTKKKLHLFAVDTAAKLRVMAQLVEEEGFKRARVHA